MTTPAYTLLYKSRSFVHFIKMAEEKVLNLIKDWKLHMTCYVKAAERISSEIINIISMADDTIYEEIVPEIGLFDRKDVF